jgi:rubrerythrin
MKERSIDELMTMQEILRTAIEKEESACSFYLNAKERARTPMEEELFARLAEQEQGHKEMLQQQLQEIQAQIDIDRALSYDVY